MSLDFDMENEINGFIECMTKANWENHQVLSALLRPRVSSVCMPIFIIVENLRFLSVSIHEESTQLFSVKHYSRKRERKRKKRWSYCWILYSKIFYFYLIIMIFFFALKHTLEPKLFVLDLKIMQRCILFEKSHNHCDITMKCHNFSSDFHNAMCSPAY